MPSLGGRGPLRVFLPFFEQHSVASPVPALNALVAFLRRFPSTFCLTRTLQGGSVMRILHGIDLSDGLAGMEALLGFPVFS